MLFGLKDLIFCLKHTKNVFDKIYLITSSPCCKRVKDLIAETRLKYIRDSLVKLIIFTARTRDYRIRLFNARKCKAMAKAIIAETNG